jgi:hypothetical protein
MKLIHIYFRSGQLLVVAGRRLNVCDVKFCQCQLTGQIPPIILNTLGNLSESLIEFAINTYLDDRLRLGIKVGYLPLSMSMDMSFG